MNITAFWDTETHSLIKVTGISQVITISFIRALMMDAVSTSETSINFHETTWSNIPEGCHLQLLNRFQHFNNEYIL
jgi:hypothetical protein